MEAELAMPTARNAFMRLALRWCWELFGLGRLPRDLTRDF